MLDTWSSSSTSFFWGSYSPMGGVLRTQAMVNLDVVPIVTRIIKESTNNDVLEQGTTRFVQTLSAGEYPKSSGGLIKAWRVSMFFFDAEKCSWEKPFVMKVAGCIYIYSWALAKIGFLHCLKVLTLDMLDC